MCMVPLVLGIRRRIVLKRIDLPAPFGPIMAVVVPDFTLKFSSSRMM